MSGNLYPKEQIFVRVYSAYGEEQDKIAIYTSRDMNLFERVQTKLDLEMPVKIPGTELTMPPRAKRISEADADVIFADNLGSGAMIPLVEFISPDGNISSDNIKAINDKLTTELAVEILKIAEITEMPKPKLKS